MAGSRGIERIVAAANRVVTWLETVVAAVLVLMVGLGLVVLGFQFYAVFVHDFPSIGVDAIINVLDVVLIIFIVIELFNIAIAYMQHRSVVPTVLEAALVAVARKLVVFEASAGTALSEAAGLAIMLIAIAVAWYLLRHGNVCCGPESAPSIRAEHAPLTSSDD